MLAPLLALAMTYPFQETSQTLAKPIVRMIRKAHAEAAVAILDSAPHPVKVRFVSVGPIGEPDDSYAYFFNQIVSLFKMTEGRWQLEDIEQVSQKDAGTSLGQ